MIKNLLFIAFTSFLVMSCGLSEEEKEQAKFDATVKSACECAKTHKDDFIEMDKCYEMVNAALEEYKDNSERFDELEKSFSDCIKSE